MPKFTTTLSQETLSYIQGKAARDRRSLSNTLQYLLELGIQSDASLGRTGNPSSAPANEADYTIVPQTAEPPKPAIVIPEMFKRNTLDAMYGKKE